MCVLITNSFTKAGSKINTVKHAHAVTSIKQSPVLKGHPFLALSWKIWNSFKRSTGLKRPPFLCLKGDLLIEVWLYINKTVSTFSDIHSFKFRLMWLSIHLTWICKHAMSNTKHSKIYTLYEPLNNIWPITQHEWSAVTVCWVDYDLLFLNVYLVIVFKQCQTVFQLYIQNRDSVGWACVAHLSFCFEET